MYGCFILCRGTLVDDGKAPAHLLPGWLPLDGLSAHNGRIDIAAWPIAAGEEGSH